MPVRVRCPHCQTTCQVAEQHVGKPVQCGRCSRTFTTRPSAQGHGPPPVPRLDIGAAASDGSFQTDCFLVRHLAWTQLEERHELGVLVIAASPMVRTVCAALSPLLRNALGGTNKEAAGVPEVIAGVLETNQPVGNAAVVVAWDGQVYIGRGCGCFLFHYHGGQLSEIPAERPSQRSIVSDDWIVATSEGSPAKMDPNSIQEDMTKLPCAGRLAQQWAERSGAVVVALRAV